MSGRFCVKPVWFAGPRPRAASEGFHQLRRVQGPDLHGGVHEADQRQPARWELLNMRTNEFYFIIINPLFRPNTIKTISSLKDPEDADEDVRPLPKTSRPNQSQIFVFKVEMTNDVRKSLGEQCSNYQARWWQHHAVELFLFHKQEGKTVRAAGRYGRTIPNYEQCTTAVAASCCGTILMSVELLWIEYRPAR